MKENSVTEAFTIGLPAPWPSFVAQADEPLLHAAERAGIALASSCRNGTCRTCICRMERGQVRYAIEWPGLLREEKEAGYVLPCVAHALSDLTLTEVKLTADYWPPADHAQPTSERA